MEKWKVGIILLLLASLLGYSAYQQNAGSSVPTALNGDQPPNGDQQPDAAPTPNPKLEALIGTRPLPWGFPANQWMNAPKPIKLDDLKGHVALIEFWRIGCSHCVASVPSMIALHRKYKDRGFKIVTFQSPGSDPSADEQRWGVVQSWARERGITYPVAFDQGRKLKDSYGIELYPFIMVLDRDGVIRFTQTGHTLEKEQELAAFIEKMMAESKPMSKPAARP